LGPKEPIAGLSKTGVMLARIDSCAVLGIEAQLVRTEVDVGALVAGRLSRVLVEEGRYVKRGELVAELDPKDIEPQVTQARGAVAAPQKSARARHAHQDARSIRPGSRSRPDLAPSRAGLPRATAY
jgi:multidrug efflux pump subunit AcrA (membrane-fusion protein)